MTLPISRNLIKYLLVATVIVIIELIIFQLIYEATKHYVIATIISFLVAVVINWAASRTVVFGASHFSMKREFLLVLAVSTVGLGIQLGVGYICVNSFKLYPLLGKIGSIFISFFWNYWFREHFVFSKSRHEAGPADLAEHIDTSIF